jgi:hypothetical protein
MAVQKKKKTKKCPTKSDGFTWTPKRRLAAKLLSESTDSYEDIAKSVGICRDTLFEWRKEPVFLDEVARLVLNHETFSLAGLLKSCKRGLEIKEQYISEDKNTYLDYIKEIAELKGHVKQKVELDANMKHEVRDMSKMTDEELVDIINSE